MKRKIELGDLIIFKEEPGVLTQILYTYGAYIKIIFFDTLEEVEYRKDYVQACVNDELATILNLE